MINGEGCRQIMTENGHQGRGQCLGFYDGGATVKNRNSVHPGNYFANRNYITGIDLFESVPFSE